MIENFKVIDIMNYPNYTEVGRDMFYGGPETSFLLKHGSKDMLPPPLTTEQYVQQMDAAGYDMVFLSAVKMGSYRCRRMNVDYSNEMVYEEVKKAPDRLVGICGYDPLNVMDSIRAIEKAVKEYGFKGVYAHPITWGIAANDRRMYPLYTKCVELDIPISMQVGQSYEPLPSEPGRPIYVDQVALDFPGLKFIMSHTGYPWHEEAVALCSKHDNLYMDCSAHPPKVVAARMKPLLDFMDTGLGRNKVLFGTNSMPFPMVTPGFMALPLKDESKAAILAGNATRLFKL